MQWLLVGGAERPGPKLSRPLHSPLLDARALRLGSRNSRLPNEARWRGLQRKPEGKREETRMKRRREQQGTVYAKSGMWYVRYSDFRVTGGQLQRKRLAKQLGAMADMTKKQARTEAKTFLAGI